jgi:hypothetical protein
MADVNFYTDKIFDRAHRTGEELKNDLPNLIRRAVDLNVWKQRVNPATGKPFATVGQWLVANYPLGPAMGNGRFSVSYDEMITLCDQHPDVKDMLVKHRPVRAKGRPAKTTDENGYNVTNNADAIERGNSRAYIEQRLSRDFPKIWKDYLNGKFRSARQAAIAAGFIKDTHDPLMRLKAYWNKATKKQRAEFLKWAAQG